MASRAFPAPPDISEILKFFASSPETYARIPRQKVDSSSRQPHSGEHHSTRDGVAAIGYHQLKQQERFHRKQQSQRKANNDSKDASDELSPPPARDQRRRRPTSRPRRSSPSPPSPPSPPPQTRREPTPQAWNGSTQLSAHSTKPLKHQILDRTYQPPAPVVVDAADATHLVERLTMTTISSRLKRHQADQHASSAVSIARATAKEQQRSLKSPPDTRAHDGIQMLLMYRKEVEKRLSLDPTYYTKST